MAFGSDFPARDGDLQMVPDRLVQYTLGKDHVQPAPADVVASVPDFRRGLPGRLLWEEPRDVVFIHMDPFWGDFFGTSAVRHRPVPFIDAIPVSICTWSVSSCASQKTGCPTTSRARAWCRSTCACRPCTSRGMAPVCSPSSSRRQFSILKQTRYVAGVLEKPMLTGETCDEVANKCFERRHRRP
ncbi:uncharacterized protein LOC119102086 [Pollicipes pollicipes]|uniref:uncharacterized protein LOC119102086 n=1 Tax=Pollicipes pollicipes TaxID=41117 RepID=UPI0018854F57|nr:uncharacterized protein LOC119102086 [Pollicipes pollicipes]